VFGHAADVCPKDPNYRTSHRMTEEASRLADLKRHLRNPTRQIQHSLTQERVLNETDLAEKCVVTPDDEPWPDLSSLRNFLEFDTTKNLTGVEEIRTKELK
jgi:hypothetical protein